MEKGKVYLLAALSAMLLLSGCTKVEPAEGSTVEITVQGFSPQQLKVRAGDTVTFINRDSLPHWPASAIHPSHDDYPEQGGCIGSAFDACRGLKTGETFSFTFWQNGTWHYHDHLHSAFRGTIVVK